GWRDQLMTEKTGSDNPAAQAWDVLSQLNGPIAATLADRAGAWTKCCLEWQRETAEFVGGRLAADLRAHETAMQCRDLGELCKAQQEWATTATRDYLNEIG